MSYYMDYPDWYDTEMEDFDKPCPECGGKMRAGPMFDQGCYEGMVYHCTDRKCGSQWVFSTDMWIPAYWNSPPCPCCEGLYADYNLATDGYDCPQCKIRFQMRLAESG